jgi:hypothetical protein
MEGRGARAGSYGPPLIHTYIHTYVLEIHVAGRKKLYTLTIAFFSLCNYDAQLWVYVTQTFLVTS